MNDQLKFKNKLIGECEERICKEIIEYGKKFIPNSEKTDNILALEICYIVFEELKRLERKMEAKAKKKGVKK